MHANAFTRPQMPTPTAFAFCATQVATRRSRYGAYERRIHQRVSYLNPCREHRDHAECASVPLVCGYRVQDDVCAGPAGPLRSSPATSAGSVHATSTNNVVLDICSFSSAPRYLVDRLEKTADYRRRKRCTSNGVPIGEHRKSYVDREEDHVVPCSLHRLAQQTMRNEISDGLTEMRSQTSNPDRCRGVN